MLWKLLLASLLLLPLFPESALSDEARLACIADATISSYPGETELNYGASSRLRLKGVQMLALMQFDLQPVAGWKVESATLHVRYGGSDRKLRTIGVSTVSAPWSEGTGAGEKKRGEVSFAWRETEKTTWAGPQTDFTDVSFSAGQTLTCYADIVLGADDWFTVSIDPRIVQAMIAATSFGLAVSDEKGQTTANNAVFSREQSNSKPYLVLRGGPSGGQRPGAITDLHIRPDATRSDFDAGAVTVNFSAPRGTFSYRMRFSSGGKVSDVPRYRIPFAEPGLPSTVSLSDLPVDRPLEWIEMVPISETGADGPAARSGPVEVKPKLRPPALKRPVAAKAGIGAEPAGTREFRVWACPESTKAHPISGNLLEEAGPEKYGAQAFGSYRVSNPIWDGKRVTLSGARSEILGCNIVVESAGPELADVRITFDGKLRSAGGVAVDVRPSLYRAWYVKDGDWNPEVAVPLKGAFTIPAADNGVTGQKNQTIVVDLLIPKAASPGAYSGNIYIATGSSTHTLPIEVLVNDLILPDTLSFDVSLNAYGTVGHLFGVDDRAPEYRAIERDFHRIAHAHRTTFANLGYSHSGGISTNYAPPVAGEGKAAHVVDWSKWDEQFGPYLDGSAFSDLPRAGVPVSHLYLPFHEAWPADIRKHYRYTPKTADYPATITEHALAAPPIEQAMSSTFADEFVTIMSEADRHFAQKGWTKTEFHFYLNNKNYYKDPKQGGRGTSWWLLDEPNYRDDWLALAYFGRLHRQAVGARRLIVHREDLSRPEWQRDYLRNLVDLIVVGGAYFRKQPMMRELKRQEQLRYWTYGTANEIRATNLEMEAWALKSWLHGAVGIVPWNSVGADRNFTTADPTALLLPGTRFGIRGPVASLRLKALRRAQQDVEYLVILAKTKGWDEDQTAAALRDLLDLRSDFRQAGPEDAGRFEFGGLSPARFDAMRRAVARAVANAP
jgi:hypothetical protein